MDPILSEAVDRYQEDGLNKNEYIYYTSIISRRSVTNSRRYK